MASNWGRRLREGVFQGLVISAIMISLMFGLSRLIGDSPLEKRIDRNAALTAASQKGLRCILTLEPDPKRTFSETQQLINDCYKEFDHLVKEYTSEN